MTVPERLTALRSLMQEQNIDAYLVPTDDFHNSEYVGDYFKCRKFITGFTGSAGTAVITRDSAYLWTDGRYFIQAAAQLEGSGVELMKMGEEGVPTISEFLLSNLTEGQALGFDGRTMNAQSTELLCRRLKKKGVSVKEDLDLVGDVWTDRPALSCEPVYTLPIEYAGKSRTDKIADVRTAMKENGAEYFLLTSLDDIAWLLNIRGNDVACNPVVLSYLAMTADETILFAQKAAFSEEVLAELTADGITLRPYNDIYAYASEIHPGYTVLLDSGSVNFALKNCLQNNVWVCDEANPTLLPKACKNPVEVEHMRQAHIKDGVAVTRFVRWLKENVAKETITEMSAAVQLEKFRGMGENYKGPSFEPIISYGTHAAIVHYSATEETDIALKPEGSVLCDTGGQYLEGTTDITRTVVLGPVSQKEKEFFTRVLRGNLNLANCKFLYGMRGTSLDYVAREPLWEVGENYNHGTGHGVGFLLNVHEGPQNIRWKTREGQRDAVLEEGMITSNEPGIYFEGEFGIRHENLILCKKAEKNGNGQFMEFETITMVPWDLDGIIPEMLSEKEKALLNDYHKTVYETISPFMDEEEKEWLKNATRAI